MKTFVALQLL